MQLPGNPGNHGNIVEVPDGENEVGYQIRWHNEVKNSSNHHNDRRAWHFAIVRPHPGVHETYESLQVIDDVADARAAQIDTGNCTFAQFPQLAPILEKRLSAAAETLEAERRPGSVTAHAAASRTA